MIGLLAQQGQTIPSPDFWDQFYLVTNRLTILFVTGLGAFFTWRRLFSSHLGIVPKPMWLFVSICQTLLFAEVFLFLVTDTDRLSTWQRTTYGALLIYTIAGLLLIVKRATDEILSALKRAEKYQQIIQQTTNGEGTHVVLRKDVTEKIKEVVPSLSEEKGAS